MAQEVETERPQLVLQTWSDLLFLALTDEYGRDLLCIGYGAQVHVHGIEAIEKNLHERLLELITPWSTWAERLERHPWRCANYLAHDPGARLALRNKLWGRDHSQSPLYALENWTSAQATTEVVSG